MKRWLSAVVVAALLASPLAQAKRLAGGTSVGKQSTNVTQRSTASTPSAPAAPAPAPNVAKTPTPAPAAPTPAPARRPWGSMLGGLAAGLGLAWLASSLGLGAGFADVMLLALLVLVVVAVVRALRRPKPATVMSSYAYQGATDATAATAPRDYSPKNVGNDASARPWEHTGFETMSSAGSDGSLIGAALGPSQSAWGVPADFDVQGFLAASKANFVQLQDAWDRGDVPALRAMMTDDMIGQIQVQLTEREAHAHGQSNRTEVVMLEAQLLGIEDLPQEYMASVEFSGLIREDAAGPNPFREVWNVTRPKSGPGGWLVAGVQALQ